jgi:hypothetical protein
MRMTPLTMMENNRNDNGANATDDANNNEDEKKNKSNDNDYKVTMLKIPMKAKKTTRVRLKMTPLRRISMLKLTKANSVMRTLTERGQSRMRTRKKHSSSGVKEPR